MNKWVYEAIGACHTCDSTSSILTELPVLPTIHVQWQIVHAPYIGSDLSRRCRSFVRERVCNLRLCAAAMASLFDTLIADIEGVHGYITLQAHTSTAAVMDGVMSFQADHVQGRVRQLTDLHVTQAHRLSELVIGGPWSAQHRDRLLDTINRQLAAASNGSATSQQRRPNQEFRSLQHFVNQARMNTLCSEKGSRVEKVDAVVAILLDLDLVHPSERTFAHVAAATIILAKLPQDPHTMYNTIVELKGQLQRRRHNVATESYVVNFPDNPMGLRADKQPLFTGPELTPVDTGVTQSTVDELATRIPLRKSKKTIQPPSQAIQLPTAHPDPTRMMQAAAFAFMQHMNRSQGEVMLNFPLAGQQHQQQQLRHQKMLQDAPVSAASTAMVPYTGATSHTGRHA